jgi:predicted nucleotidyltransferase
MNPYTSLFKAMNEADIRYLIIGGVAVNLHGYRRFTADIDILLALDEDNLIKMSNLMHSLGYTERVPVQLQELTNTTTIRKPEQEKGMSAFTFLSGKEERIDVDILTTASMAFSNYDIHKVMIDINDNVQVPVVSIDDLIALKHDVDREKDREDIKALLELKDL